MSVKVIFYILYLLEPSKPYREKFDELSEIIRAKTNNLEKFYPGFKCIPANNSEEWCKLTGKLGDDSAEAKYYKERIILKVETECEGKDLNELFKQIKTKRRILLSNKMVNLNYAQDNLCKLYNNNKACIRSVYLYPLITIEEDYDELYRSDFDDEAITTFFYEIPDVGNVIRCAFLPFGYKKVLMRVSGPSIITTKMSPIMKAKLINLIYESALYKMREYERNNRYQPCKEISGENYEYLRNYIAETFFTIESGISSIEMTSSLQMLSYISALGVTAGLLSISYAVFHIMPIQLEVFKTYIAILLFLIMIFIIKKIIRIKFLDYLKKKFFPNYSLTNRIQHRLK